MDNAEYDNILFDVVLLRKQLREFYKTEVIDANVDSLNSKATLLNNALEAVAHLTATLEFYDKQFITK